MNIQKDSHLELHQSGILYYYKDQTKIEVTATKMFSLVISRKLYFS